MRVLLSLTYYHPHISGITVYNHRLAKALVAEGHQATVVTSQFRDDLPREEVVDGVEIYRLPVGFWISKGAIMPGFPREFARMLDEHDIAIMNVPNTPVEAFAAPIIARWKGKPLLVMHMCDVQLPPGFINYIVGRAVFLASLFAAAASDGVSSMTHDYASHSPVLRHFMKKLTVIPPPVEWPPAAEPALPSDDLAAEWRRRKGVEGGPLIGFAARFSTEKGVDVMLRALPEILAHYPDARVLFGGEYEKVFGERHYRDRLGALLESQRGHWHFLGPLPQEEMPHFYHSCAVTVLPSVNRTESFGLVQVESMACGTPVVASDLPGVRDAVVKTGMGKIAPAGDARGLAAAVLEVLRERKRYVKNREEIAGVYHTDRTRRMWESLIRGSCDARQIAWTHLREKPWFLALQRAAEHNLLARAGPFERPILDVGTGDGHFGPAALGCTIDAGVDLDIRCAARAKGRRFNGRIAYRGLFNASAVNLPFASNSFATILSNSTLEHIPGVDAALREMFRVLKPGGRLLITVPTDKWEPALCIPRWLRRVGLSRVAIRYQDWFRRKQRHYHLLSPGEWTRRAGAAGFCIESVRQYFSAEATGWLEVLHYAGWTNLLAKALAGRWVIAPWRPRFFLAEWLVARHVHEPEKSTDTCLLLAARKPSAYDCAQDASSPGAAPSTEGRA